MNLSELLISCSSKDDAIISYLDLMLSQLIEDLPLIYSAELAGVDVKMIDEAAAQIRSHFAGMAGNLQSLVSNTTNTSFVSQLKKVDAGSLFCSGKLGLSGIPHFVLNEDDVQIPLIIKTGKYPETGVWANDRLHLTALAMLMGEANSTPVGSGIVLYAIHAELRPVTIRSNERRQVLKVLGRVRKIKEGSMPDKKTGPLCQGCAHGSLCNVRPSLASKFF
ncbi:Dna2/Cas4 domain-containing protein [Methanolobus sp. ZRKC3]|uniref:CRISPR-associated protein Cas4 n=1 Tax=Methanolobus sp. ZRKC3 TaxID=3125786 RepID=UPI0032525307